VPHVPVLHVGFFGFGLVLGWFCFGFGCRTLALEPVKKASEFLSCKIESLP
jgi:hypothetical protein